MKNLWTWILLSALLGIATAAVANYTTFGSRDAFFGPFGTNNEMTAADLPAYRQSLLPDGRPKVELVDEPSFDFGLMAPDTEGEHLFRVKNVGTGIQIVRWWFGRRLLGRYRAIVQTACTKNGEPWFRLSRRITALVIEG